MDGLYRTDDERFERVGPPAPWKTQPSGFWVGAGDVVAVIEPESSTLYTLDAPSADWKSESVPLLRPLDVAGPPSDRFVAGAGGLLHRVESSWSGVDGTKGPLDRVIVASWGTIVGGRGGVFEVSRTPDATP